LVIHVKYYEMTQLSNTFVQETRDGRRSLVRAFEMICKEPVARSTLRARLQTSPSTVTLSVQTLRERGLVVETQTGGPTGGRRARIVDLAPTLGGVLAVDVGGINLRVAAANRRGQILGKAVVSTPPSFDGFGQALRAGLEQVRSSLIGPVRSIAVAVPGVVDPHSGAIRNIENLPDWRTDDFEEVLTSFGTPIIIENEANLAAFAEHRIGNAQGAESVLFIAVGAGIGAGLIVGGNLFRGANGAAGEIGYLRTGTRQEPGTLEEEAGAEAVVRKYRKHGGTSPVASAEDVFGRTRLRDQAARAAVDEVVDALTIGIANAIAMFDPKIVVVGGGVAEAGETLLVPLRKNIAQLVPRMPELRLSALGQDAALIGAICRATEHARNVISSELEQSVV
jgi:predicted NBD/HSP70 family sugar kinase